MLDRRIEEEQQRKAESLDRRMQRSFAPSPSDRKSSSAGDVGKVVKVIGDGEGRILPVQERRNPSKKRPAEARGNNLHSHNDANRDFMPQHVIVPNKLEPDVLACNFSLCSAS